MSIATSETRNIASLVINRAITKRTTNVGDNNNVIKIVPGGNAKRPIKYRFNQSCSGRNDRADSKELKNG